MANNNYTDWHIIEYNKKRYIFNPFLFGIGAWAILTANNKPGKYVERPLQIALNKFFFEREELPSLYERFNQANMTEKQKLRDISIGWLQLKVKGIRQNIEVPKTIATNNRQFTEGMMYFFTYDAKYKDTLPMWDKFPLVILLEKYSDGFLGLNLHYLDENVRLMFLSNLLSDMSVYNKGNDKLKLQISYRKLANAFQYKDHKTCVKRYLDSHVQSRILPVESHEWIYAAALPVAEFKYNRKKKNA